MSTLALHFANCLTNRAMSFLYNHAVVRHSTCIQTLLHIPSSSAATSRSQQPNLLSIIQQVRASGAVNRASLLVLLLLLPRAHAASNIQSTAACYCYSCFPLPCLALKRSTPICN